MDRVAVLGEPPAIGDLLVLPRRCAGYPRRRLKVRISPLVRTGVAGLRILTTTGARISSSKRRPLGVLRPGHTDTEFVTLPHFRPGNTGDDQWVAGLLTAPVTNYAYYVTSCNGSYCTPASSPLAVTALPGGNAPMSRARLSPARRAAVSNMLDPSRLLYREGLGMPPVLPDPAP
jgi:hypothetical protein